MRVSSSADPTGASVSFTIVDAPEATPVAQPQVRAAHVALEISGSGPWTALFGGSAERDIILRVENNGTEPLVDTPINLTFGKGSDPTAPALQADGGPVQLGSLLPGQEVELRIPVTTEVPTIGTYTAKVTIIGLNRLTSGETTLPEGSPSIKATTSSYPWALIVLAWLLLQIPLLGLYRRRDVVVEDAPADIEAPLPHL